MPRPYRMRCSAWSSDLLRIARIRHVIQVYVTHADIVRKEFGSSELTRIKDSTASSNEWPTWSPAGTQIAYVSDQDGQTDIYLTDGDGSGIYRVTDDEAIESELDWTR